jgi:hypothetical protein
MVPTQHLFLGGFMSDLYNYEGELLVSPGECWDRLTILELKIIKIKDVGKNRVAANEWRRVVQLIENIHQANCVPKEQGEPRWDLLIWWVDCLRKQNAIQWDCEDRVRVENSWEAAQAARDSNTKRIQIKNRINELYGYAEDVKCYAGEHED